MITKTLSEFVVETNYDSIPENAITAAKKAILDYLGVAIAGSRASTGRVITEYVGQEGGVPEAGVIAGGFKTSPFLAALSNGTLGHALDFDDECESWNSHPTTVILPAVLALGEKLGGSGQDMLVSYIVGWEVAARIGAIVYPKMYDRGGHPTPVVGSLAAAAAAARVLKLGTEQTQRALGIAASQAAGLQANHGTDTKPLHAGLAASNGVRSAQLARLGFTANANILEDPIGYLMAMGGKNYKTPNLAELGTPFDITVSLCIKLYPSCYLNQRPMDSIFHLIKEHRIRSEDAAEVEVKAHPRQIKVCRYLRPRTGLQAKFSLHYSMAAPIIYGNAGLEEYTDNKVLDPKIQEFLPKVKVIPIDVKDDQEVYRHCGAGQMVTVRLRDGSQYSYDARCPRGHALNPVTWDEVAAKFRSCTEAILSKEDIEHCIELVEQFESIKDVTQLMSAITKTSGSTLL